MGNENSPQSHTTRFLEMVAAGFIGAGIGVAIQIAGNVQSIIDVIVFVFIIMIIGAILYAIAHWSSIIEFLKNKKSPATGNKSNKRLKSDKLILWLTLIATILTLFSVYLVMIDYPEYPFAGTVVTFSEKECFVGDDYRNPTVNCDITYNVKTASSRRVFPFYLFNNENQTVPFKPGNDIETYFDYGDRYQDVDCKNFIGQSGDIVCTLSGKKSRDYTIDITYKKPLLDECPKPEQISLDKHGSATDCSLDECVLNLKVESSPECGLRGYRVVGPESWAAGDKVILIDENGLPYDLVKANDGKYSFDVTMGSGEWKVYTIHFPKPVIPK